MRALFALLFSVMLVGSGGCKADKSTSKTDTEPAASSDTAKRGKRYTPKSHVEAQGHTRAAGDLRLPAAATSDSQTPTSERPAAPTLEHPAGNATSQDGPTFVADRDQRNAAIRASVNAVTEQMRPRKLSQPRGRTKAEKEALVRMKERLKSGEITKEEALEELHRAQRPHTTGRVSNQSPNK